jgi:hypothetical protein
MVTVRPFRACPPVRRAGAGGVVVDDGTRPDPVLGRSLTRREAVEVYGAAVCGVSGRRLGKREVRRYGGVTDTSR